MGRRAPELLPVTFALEASDLAWLLAMAAAKELTPTRYLQRLVMYARRRDERNQEQSAAAAVATDGKCPNT